MLPGTATLDGQIIGISSPYMKSGLLFDKHQKHFGQDSDDIVVIQAPSRTLNPTIPAEIVEQALIDDPAGAAAEWLAQFRDDISGFIPYDIVQHCIVPGRTELQPLRGISYNAIDVASGIAKAGDSMTLGIAHQWDDGVVAIDLVREAIPPFQTDIVTAEFAEVMRRYGITRAVSDRVGLGWVGKAFYNCSITLGYSSRTKSEIYLTALPMLGNRTIELLDNPRLRSQILNLERRVNRGGHEGVDHPTGAAYHDDVANAALGAAIETLQRIRWAAA